MIRFPRWKIIVIALVCILGFSFAAPNLLTKAQRAQLPSWVPSKAMNLGLDLRGGSHLLLEVDVKTVFRERLTNLVQAMRTELRKERIPYRNIGAIADHATVTIIDPDKTGTGNGTNIERARRILRGLEPGLEVTNEDAGKLAVRYTEAAMREKRDQALVQSVSADRVTLLLEILGRPQTVQVEFGRIAPL